MVPLGLILFYGPVQLFSCNSHSTGISSVLLRHSKTSCNGIYVKNNLWLLHKFTDVQLTLCSTMMINFSINLLSSLQESRYHLSSNLRERKYGCLKKIYFQHRGDKFSVKFKSTFKAIFLMLRSKVKISNLMAPTERWP